MPTTGLRSWSGSATCWPSSSRCWSTEEPTPWTGSTPTTGERPPTTRPGCAWCSTRSPRSPTRARSAGTDGSAERLLRRAREIRHDADALPVRAGDRVDRARDRHVQLEVGREVERLARVCPAAGRLADGPGSAECLQVVGELLPAAEGPLAGQHHDGYVGGQPGGDRGSRVRRGDGAVPVDQVLQVHRLVAGQVTDDERDRLRHP